MCVGHHDCLADGQNFSGITSLCVRLLKSKGFKVFVIKHNDFKPHEPTLARVKLLDAKLKKLVLPPSET